MTLVSRSSAPVPLAASDPPTAALSTSITHAGRLYVSASDGGCHWLLSGPHQTRDLAEAYLPRVFRIACQHSPIGAQFAWGLFELAESASPTSGLLQSALGYTSYFCEPPPTARELTLEEFQQFCSEVRARGFDTVRTPASSST